MEFIIIGAIAAGASLLTFFSGFGLGTILTPVFVLFFPLNEAIAFTGVVHLLNNFFKLVLVGKHINFHVMLRFGITAIFGAFLGAKSLYYIFGLQSLYDYTVMGHQLSIMPMNLIISLLIILFTLIELIPRFKNIEFSSKKIVAGGFVSGFFGGLSGHQGALRSMFLIKCDLSKESFIATGITIACLVDIIRLPVYFSDISTEQISMNLPLIITATLSAFAGAFAGRRLLHKITFISVQNIVSVMIILLALLIGIGVL